jgi:hypothetical protein
MNVFRLLRLQKKVVVYTVPIKSFQELKTLRDWGSSSLPYDRAPNALASLGAMPNELPPSPARVWLMGSNKKTAVIP